MSSNTPKTLVRIDDFPLPPPKTARAIIISGIAMLLSARSSLLEPGSLFYDNILASQPAQATRIARWAQQAVFWFLFGAHSLETVGFAFARLRRHGVPIFSLLGFKWLAAVFVGGKFAWAHFDEVVARKAIGGGR
ncbi:uncharacterized protein B0I36DRAFT_329767 [Microdochium trichocladiopsis]|uniref:Integral membrane protein n=1 Tax=Microdochium trichocladiopsis TaxID=1682393 RepID=A0A9P8Y037_9PEZI|nr:uncharacterized protein B0I36DRAFT_329767 [Microdochium trichocladiopsis]KAH7026046.1 hypothetical protein B0I36DRAFT_329767 [Microdochium trichocladiopsis]